MGESVHIRVLGTSFTIQTDQRPEYVESLVVYLQEKIRLIERSSGSKESLKSAILAALLVTDELFQERSRTRESSGSEQELESFAQVLIDRIDAVLEESDGPNRGPQK